MAQRPKSFLTFGEAFLYGPTYRRRDGLYIGTLHRYFALLRVFRGRVFLPTWATEVLEYIADSLFPGKIFGNSGVVRAPNSPRTGRLSNLKIREAFRGLLTREFRYLLHRLV